MYELDTHKNIITSQFLNELSNPNFDLATDYSEIFIDDIIASEALKEIPIIKSIIGTVKTGIAINNFFNAKKLLTFIQKFNDGSIEENRYNEFRHRINTDQRFGQKLAENLLVMIDKQIEIKQTIITANLFKAYVNGHLQYEELNNILITLNTLHPSTYSYFYSLESKKFVLNDDVSRTERNLEMEGLVSSGGFGLRTSMWSSGFELNQNGIKFFKYGLKPSQHTQ